MPPTRQAKPLRFSYIPCGHTRSSTMPTRRLSLRRQILSTAGLPKPTTPLKTEESEKVLSEIPTSPFSATQKKNPKGKHLFFYFPVQETSEIKHALFLSFSISMVPRIQKTNNQNMILLVFQKFSQVCHQKILAAGSIYPPQIVVFGIRAYGSCPPGTEM